MKKKSTRKDRPIVPGKEVGEKRETANDAPSQDNALKDLSKVESIALEKWKERNKRRMSAPKFRRTSDMQVTLQVNSERQLLSHMVETTGSADDDLFKTLMSQVSLISRTENCEQKANYSAAFMHALNPGDETEGILIAQMAGTHNLIMEFIRRAVVSEQTPEVTNDNTYRACRLMSLFLKQLEALEKYRGKSSQQKVLVEHVHIHEGGRAIVGNVENKPRGEGDE